MRAADLNLTELLHFEPTKRSLHSEASVGWQARQAFADRSAHAPRRRRRAEGDKHPSHQRLVTGDVPWRNDRRFASAKGRDGGVTKLQHGVGVLAATGHEATPGPFEEEVADRVVGGADHSNDAAEVAR